jgi:ubiquinone biosynthesis accessory factor UbiJ
LSELATGQKATPEVAFSFGVAFCFFVNRLLDAAPWARERLAPFAGDAVELVARPLPALRVTILEDGRLRPGGGEAAVTVKLGPEALLALARGEEQFLRAIEVAGNARLAQELATLARHLRWDVEEDLSRLIGDVAAHRAVAAGRDFIAWQADAARRLVGAAADYLTDESPLLVRRPDQEARARMIAELRDALARLEKRLERLG